MPYVMQGLQKQIEICWLGEVVFLANGDNGLHDCVGYIFREWRLYFVVGIAIGYLLRIALENLIANTEMREHYAPVSPVDTEEQYCISPSGRKCLYYWEWPPSAPKERKYEFTLANGYRSNIVKRNVWGQIRKNQDE